MVAESDVTSFSAGMTKLSDMSLDDRVLEVFQEAERRMLKVRESGDPSEVSDVRDYVEEQRMQLLGNNYLDNVVINGQFAKGNLYIGHIALTGKVP